MRRRQRGSLAGRVAAGAVPVAVGVALFLSSTAGGAQATTARAPRRVISTTTSTVPVPATVAPVPTTPVAGPAPSTSTPTTSAPRSATFASTSARRQLTTSTTAPAPATTVPAAGISENFSSLPQGLGWTDGSSHGQWVSVFGGFGANGIASDGANGNVLSLAPQTSSAPSETHASLVRSASTFSDFDTTMQVRTVQQLRTGSAPNPWEVGWVLWHYTDNTHFYYFIAKPNGWELGKEDPAYPGAQRFLAAGSAPSYPVGAWNTVRVRQVGSSMTVWVNGAQVATFTDAERPYVSGALGVYAEDSVVHFDNIDLAKL